MLDYITSDALSDFAKVASLAGAAFQLDQVEIQIVRRPHRARALPPGKIGVYSFFWGERALKVGKVGQNSGPRFTYQHYTGSAPSTLAGSILSNPGKVGAVGINRETVRHWIETNTDRIDILLPASVGSAVLSLLEAFLHVRWSPAFEGNQKAD